MMKGKKDLTNINFYIYEYTEHYNAMNVIF